MIEPPEVWLTFGLYIYQEFFSIHSELYDGFLFALEGLNSSEKHELLNFVRNTLSANHSNQYLIELWGKSGASDILVSDQMKVVYEVLLQATEASLELKG